MSNNNDDFNSANQSLETGWEPPIDEQPTSGNDPYTIQNTTSTDGFQNPYISSNSSTNTDSTSTYGTTNNNPYTTPTQGTTNYDSMNNSYGSTKTTSYSSQGTYNQGYSNNSYNAYNNNHQEPNTASTVSLILGIAGLVLSCCCGIGGLLGIGAIILAIISKGNRPMNSKAIAGIITGIIGVIISIISIIYLVTYNAADAYNYYRYYNQNNNSIVSQYNSEFSNFTVENEVTDSLLQEISK